MHAEVHCILNILMPAQYCVTFLLYTFERIQLQQVHRRGRVTRDPFAGCSSTQEPVVPLQYITPFLTQPGFEFRSSGLSPTQGAGIPDVPQAQTVLFCLQHHWASAPPLHGIPAWWPLCALSWQPAFTPNAVLSMWIPQPTILHWRL